MQVKVDSSLKVLIQEFNEQTKNEFNYLREDKYDLLRNKTWLNINGIPAIHSKYSPQQQKYALGKCLEMNKEKDLKESKFFKQFRQNDI